MVLERKRQQWPDSAPLSLLSHGFSAFVSFHIEKKKALSTFLHYQNAFGSALVQGPSLCTPRQAFACMMAPTCGLTAS